MTWLQMRVEKKERTIFADMSMQWSRSPSTQLEFGQPIGSQASQNAGVPALFESTEQNHYRKTCLIKNNNSVNCTKKSRKMVTSIMDALL